MAAFRDSTVLPRRAVIAGAAAALAATLPMPTPAHADPGFAGKVEKLRAVQAAYAQKLEERAALDAVIPYPEKPRELWESFSIAGTDHMVSPKSWGWLAEDLHAIASGNYLRTAGWLYFLGPDHPIRRRAVELLEVARAYDAAREHYWGHFTAIEDDMRRLGREEWAIALDIMRCPVSTLAEVREKIAIADEARLFEDLGDEAGPEAREAIFRDILAIADAAGSA